MQLLTFYSLNYSDVTIRSYEQKLNCKCQTEAECCQKTKTRFKLQRSVNPPPRPPPQLYCNLLTEGFIYSPLHAHRTDFIEQGIKANKRTKNEKDLISENFLSLDLGKSER